jgi:arabinofuranosyltransferase
LFAYNVYHYAFLIDDAFISFRYADNLARGEGLTWNPGERVEGYTSFLWVLLMAASLRLGIAPELSSQVLGVACGVGILLALWRLGVRRFGPASPFSYLPLAALATSRSFCGWCTGGLATTAFTLAVMLALLAFAREQESRAERPGSGLLFALAALLRPEGILFTAVAGAFAGISVLRGQRSLRSVLVWAAPWVVIVSSHFLWRRSYYGFWLPNTFYAKVGGAWLDQSLAYLSLFQADYQLAWFLPVVGLLLLRRRDVLTWILAVSSLCYLAYILYVGGDRFEFRFLVVILPATYWLIAAGLREIARAPTLTGLPGGGGVVSGVVAGLLLLTTHLGSVSDEAREERKNVQSLDNIRRYADLRAQQGRQLRDFISMGLLPSDLVVCIGGAGAIPYYTRWVAIDRYGLNDSYVAHLPLARRGLIAHERKAPYAYLEERKVVAFTYRDLLTPRLSFQAVGREWQDRALPARALALPGHYFAFGSMVSDTLLAEIFPGLEIVDLDALQAVRSR